VSLVYEGTKAQIIFACIVKSSLWSNTKVFHLQQNMRSLQDHNFAEYLMHIMGLNPQILMIW